MKITDDAVQEWAQMVVEVAAHDEVICAAAREGELTDDLLRAELPRIFEAVQEATARNANRYRDDAVYRHALGYAIYSDLLHLDWLATLEGLRND